MICGYAGKVIKIDLAERNVSEYPLSDEDRKNYIGGKGLAAKIIFDLIKGIIEPFSKDNVIVVSTGPLNGVGAPSSARFNVSGISPLTGLLASSNCGGNFGLNLKRAGYDAVILTGRAQEKTHLEITEEGVAFRDASGIWGETTSKTQEILGGKRGMLVIGPAGENLVRYAGIWSGERTAGRAGLGAVLGYMNVKAITAAGNKKAEVYDRDKLKIHCAKWVKKLQNHPMTGKQLPDRGTASLVLPMQKNRQLATKNYRYGRFEQYENICGEMLKDKYLIRNSGCLTCPIRCSRVVPYQGKEIKGPELETIGLLGSNLLNGDMDKIIHMNYVLDELGLDTMTTGGVLGFAMELAENGLLDFPLSFGNLEGIDKLLEDIAYRRGIGDLLAEGTRIMARKLGGSAYAIQVKGMELAAYEPRGAVGQGLGYAVANRGGCHLNAGYPIILEGLGLRMNRYTKLSKAKFAIFTQNLMDAVSSAGICLFTTYAVFPGIVYKRNPVAWLTARILKFAGPVVGFLNRHSNLIRINVPLLPHSKAYELATGLKTGFGGFIKAGERIYNLERLINLRLGMNGEMDDDLPQRLKDEEQVPGDRRTKVPIKKLKSAYYKARGWNERGVPGDKRLKKLGL